MRSVRSDSRRGAKPARRSRALSCQRCQPPMARRSRPGPGGPAAGRYAPGLPCLAVPSHAKREDSLRTAAVEQDDERGEEQRGRWIRRSGAGRSAASSPGQSMLRQSLRG